MKAFIPETLPIKTINWERHLPAIRKAHDALDRYDGLLQSMASPGLLLSSLTTQEAVLSCKIEQSEATLEDVFDYDAEPTESPEAGRHRDIMEVLSLRRAINYARAKISNQPLSLGMIKEIHAILLDSVKGAHKNPGEFRRKQNYIVAPGGSIEQAIFIPPSPEGVMSSLDNWENYLYFEEKAPLVQLAVLRAQFEIIHPFLDGNGRIGRILIPLFLYEKKMLGSPIFYMSSHLDSHREQYYASLRAISETRDWNRMISFFLEAIAEQTGMNIAKAKSLRALYEKTQVAIFRIANSQYTAHATDALFSAPILTIASFMKTADIPKATAARIIGELRNQNILDDIREAKGSRAGKYMFRELFEIVK